MPKFKVCETYYREYVVEAETDYQAEQIAETKGVLVHEKFLDGSVEKLED